jgi:ABC-2 type transport system permease protein
MTGLINMTVAGLTVRQLFTRTRFITMVLFALVPVLSAAVFRSTTHAWDPNGDAFLVRIYEDIAVFVLLPLAAVVFGTAAFGGEIDDGTIVYLLVKTLPRWQVVLSKFVVAALATAAMMLFAIALPWLALGARPEQFAVVSAFATAITLGAVLYCALFVTLGLASKRALVLGLLYVVVLEITLSPNVAGLKSLSVREFVMTVVARLAMGQPGIHAGSVPMKTVWTVGAIMLIGGLGIGIRWLSRYQMAERV